ncbi:MAG: hypothetical protein HUK21_08665 [Fibrobacteraceae bacterium]|nr:hypothetical protein [Fibrobacteraceae bacterium]
MLCSNCSKDLPFSENILATISHCPFCGGELPKQVQEIVVAAPGSVEEKLQQLVSDFGGLDIFNEENESRFRKSLNTWEGSFYAASKKLQAALDINIPQKLFNVANSPISLQKEIVENSIDAFSVFPIPQENAIEIISWLAKVMNISCEVKPRFIDPFEGKDSGTFIDERDDEEYKWVRIGKQIWMAENLRYQNENSYAYDNNEKHVQRLGRLYTWNSAIKSVPKGWRLPSMMDWKEMQRYVERKGKDNAAYLLMGKEFYLKECGLNDPFGFNAVASGFRGDGSGLFEQCSGFERNHAGSFYAKGKVAVFWLSDYYNDIKAIAEVIGHYNPGAYYYYKSQGFSVRCIKAE